MGNPRHTIELNGQLYDAVTGRPLKAAEKIVRPTSAPQVMDGFTRRKATVTAAPALTPVKSAQPAKKHRVKVEAAKPAPKQAQRSKTLMRSAVKKPAVATAESAKHVEKKTHRIPAHRVHRASEISKSQLISKFGGVSRAAMPTTVAPLPVKAPPIHVPATPAAQLRQQIAAVTSQVARPVTAFERAIHNAESHKQPKVQRPKRMHRTAEKLHVSPKTLRRSSGLAAMVLLAGFFMYQNVPQLSMRVAATRAGVHGKMPGYRPTGFSMNRSIQYSQGQIVINFRSNSDNRSFSLIQKKTTLTNQDLLDEFVGVDNRPYQVYEDKGRKIYIYDGSSAAWVDQGVWYQIEGDSSLNSDQLIRLATSI